MYTAGEEKAYWDDTAQQKITKYNEKDMYHQKDIQIVISKIK